MQKVNYIHLNPVRAGLVDFGEDVDDVALRDVSALYPRVEADGEE